MQAIETNMENWSGKDMTVHIHEREGDTQDFEVLGNTFRAKYLFIEDEDLPDYSCHVWYVYELGDVDMEHCVMESTMFESDDAFTARSGDCMRHHAHPLVAAAKVLANTY